MNNSFFSLIFRQKYIKRWGMMRNVSDETLSEHSCEVAFVTHALATIGNMKFKRNYDVGKAVSLAIFHDCAEVYTGDLPTPVKYYSPEIRKNYALIEEEAVNALVSHLPSEFRQVYKPLLEGEKDENYVIVKAADKLCALIKCIEEEKSGNTEFSAARESTLALLNALNLPELDYFIAEFLPAFSLSLDEMQK